MNTLQNYIAKFGPEAGPKIYHVARSRAAYKGVSTRRRHRIEALTGRPYRPRRKASTASGQGLLPLAGLAEHVPGASEAPMRQVVSESGS